MPGDIIVSGYDGVVCHAALYIGDGKLVHALNSNVGIVVTINTPKSLLGFISFTSFRLFEKTFSIIADFAILVKLDHAALYIGDGKLVHALNSNVGIVVTSLYIMPIIDVRRVTTPSYPDTIISPGIISSRLICLPA